MVKKIKEYWFGGMMALLVLFCLVFVAVVGVAPHNDAKMRGFSPCTYQMAADLSDAGAQKRVWGVFAAVGGGYLCYAGVMREGAELFFKHRQPTPWANYLFEPDEGDDVEDGGDDVSAEGLPDSNLFAAESNDKLNQNIRKEFDDDGQK